MKPHNLNTQIFLDSGDPEDTKRIIENLGFLDGQTTNPSLIAIHLDEIQEKGNKLSEEELLGKYHGIIRDIADSIPEGSISIEVYADGDTMAEEMITQAREMNTWTPHAQIKLPTTREGLKAAETLSREGIMLNMTLVFTQEQAAAVYAATNGAEEGSIYVSPFIGRLDDRGENGMDLIRNIAKMFAMADPPADGQSRHGGHVLNLAASIRSYDHLLACFKAGADIITSPFHILREWGDSGCASPYETFEYKPDLAAIPYQELDLDVPWTEFNIHHELTDAGLEKFARDWKALLDES